MPSNLKRKLMIAGILAILPVALFYPILFGNLVFSGDFTGSDLLDFYYPLRNLLHTSLLHGRLPLWEPNLALGFPILAEGQMGGLNPVNLILALLPTEIGFNIAIMLVFGVAIAASYVYLRLLKRSISGALFGAIAFGCSAFFIVRFKHLDIATISAMMPVLLCFCKLYFEQFKLKWALLTGLTIGLIILTGHHQMAFYTLLGFLFYCLFEVYKTYAYDKRPAALLAFFVYLFVSFGLGISLGAVQILPTVELLQFSSRTELTDALLTAFPYNPLNLITLLSPYYFGNPAVASYQENIGYMGVFWENASYFGLIPLFFGLYAGWQVLRRRDRNIYQRFFLGMAILSLLLMLGRFTPLFLGLTKIIPLFNLFRFPTRFNLFLIMSMVVLATSTFELLMNKVSLRYRRVFVAVMLAILIGDLYIFGSNYISFMPIDQFQKTPDMIHLLSKTTGQYRIYNLTQYTVSPYRDFGWKSDVDAILAMREALPPNGHLLYSLDSFSDRTWFEGGFSLSRRNKLEDFLLHKNQNQALTGKLLGLFNTKYIISFDETIGIEISKVASYNLGPRYPSPLNLFENEQLLPRVFFVPEASVITNEDELFSRLTAEDFLPTQTVLLEKKPKNPLTEFHGVLDDFRHDNQVKIVSYQPQSVSIEANLKNPGFLVLSDTFYPGWKARVDGKNQEILEADYLVRALELSPGNHRIEFYYQPLVFWLGATISGMTWLGLAGFGGYLIWNKFKHGKR